MKRGMLLFAAGLLAACPALAQEHSSKEEAKKDTKKEAAGKPKSETHPQVKEEPPKPDPKKEEPKREDPKKEAPKGDPRKAAEKAPEKKGAEVHAAAVKPQDAPAPPPARVRTHRPSADPGKTTVASKPPSPARRPLPPMTIVRRPPVVWERDWAGAPKVEWEGSPLVQAAQMELGPQSQAAMQKMSDDLAEVKRSLEELTDIIRNMSEQKTSGPAAP